MAWLATEQGPKARSIPAWGGAPGIDRAETLGLKARPIDRSIPHIPFVVFNSVLLQKCTEFILKRLFTMVRLLRIDVLGQGVQIRRPNGKCAIPSLPCELRQTRRLRFEPFRGRRFELFNQLSHAYGARQSNGEMNMVRNSTNPKALAFGVASDRGEIGMKVRSNFRVEERPAIFRAENQMNQNKSERLGHRQDYKSGLQPSVSGRHFTWGFTPGWYKAAPLALILAISTCGCAQASHPTTPLVSEAAHAQHAPTPEKTKEAKIQIRILNAKTNQPIHDEKLNIALKKDQIGSVAMPTDKNGIIEVDTGDATIIRILSNMYADCRPRSELYTNYSIAAIRSNGITAGNLCSGARPKAHPGELILFEIPKTLVPQHPNPPVTHLPHSDEYPN